MLVVETIAKIRRAHFIQGKSIKQICRELRVSRNTVRKVIRSGATEFSYDRSTQPRPKIDPWRSQLDDMLADNTRHPKRERRMIERRIKAAKFPATKSLPSQACCACPAGQRISFNFKVIPSLNKVLTMQLARGEFIDRRANIIALGPGGTGKTHIALGLGLAACQKGRKVRFTTAAALVHELIEAVDERRLQRLQKQLVSQDLLIIDELGFVPLSKTGAELLFEIISQRYERGSIIITSNLPFDEWTEVFGAERLTGAILDSISSRTLNHD